MYTEEVEEAIKTHPAVADALVVGIPDERFGQLVTAVIAAPTADDELVEALTEDLEDRLAGYKRPRIVVRVDSVRRAPNGKPDYAWARQLVLESQNGAASPA